MEVEWELPEGFTKPFIICPDCKGWLLGDSAPHGVRADGTVHGSVVCPCGFHKDVKLKDWTGGEIQHA